MWEIFYIFNSIKISIIITIVLRRVSWWQCDLSGVEIHRQFWQLGQSRRFAQPQELSSVNPDWERHVSCRLLLSYISMKHCFWVQNFDISSSFASIFSLIGSESSSYYLTKMILNNIINPHAWTLMVLNHLNLRTRWSKFSTFYWSDSLECYGTQGLGSRWFRFRQSRKTHLLNLDFFGPSKLWSDEKGHSPLMPSLVQLF